MILLIAMPYNTAVLVVSVAGEISFSHCSGSGEWSRHPNCDEFFHDWERGNNMNNSIGYSITA